MFIYSYIHIFIYTMKHYVFIYNIDAQTYIKNTYKFIYIGCIDAQMHKCIHLYRKIHTSLYTAAQDAQMYRYHNNYYYLVLIRMVGWRKYLSYQRELIKYIQNQLINCLQKILYFVIFILYNKAVMIEKSAIWGIRDLSKQRSRNLDV